MTGHLLGDYKVTIPEAEETENGYAILAHGTQYSIELVNDTGRRADAEVKIDGGIVGVWRVEARDSIRLERPSGDTGHFTFFEVDSEEGRAAGLREGDSLGLISVEFRPEIEVDGLGAAALSDERFGAGGTGLTGESAQRFQTTSPLDFDPDDVRTIHLRLVARKPEVRPLHPKSTPVPPPV